MTFLLLQVHLWSWRNRLRVRLRRLRQPRYLVFFAIGAAYILLLWRPWRMGTGRLPAEVQIGLPAELAAAAEAGLAALLTIIFLGSWLWPRRRPALQFSETEIAFLFPAPLTRRQVVHFSLLRSQFGVLFGAAMLTFFGLRQVAPSALQALLGAWVAFATLQLATLGSAIARANLLRHGGAGLRRGAVVVAAGALVLAALVAWGIGWVRPPLPEEQGDGAAVAAYVARMLDVGPMAVVLWPGRALVRPVLARPDPLGFALACAPAVGLLALSYLWVIRSDFAYEEASAERAAAKARRRDRRRTGRRSATARPGSRRPPFTLEPRGRPEVAILWKNLIATSRFLTVRRAATLAVAAVLLSAAAGRAEGPEGLRALVQVVGVLCQVATWILFLIGPLVVRSDLRVDLLHVSLLRSWPMHGWSVVLAEALAPTLLVSGAQVGLLAVSLALLPPPFAPAAVERALLVLGLAILALPLNLLSTLVQSAAVLLFPSWMALGPERARGVEAFGQRLVATLLRALALATVFLPAALVLALGLFLGWPRFGAAVVPPVALLAAVPALLEAGVVTAALGYRFDSFDPSRELDVAA